MLHSRIVLALLACAVAVPATIVLVLSAGISPSGKLYSILLFAALCVAMAQWIYTLLRPGFHPIAVVHSLVCVWLIYTPALYHIEVGYFPFFSQFFKSDILVTGGVVSLFHSIIFFATYVAADQSLRFHRTAPMPSRNTITNLYWVVMGLCLVGVLFVFIFGFDTYWRPRANNGDVELDKAEVLIALTYPRAIPIVALVLSAYLYRMRGYWLPLLCSIIISAVLLAPQSAPRVQVIGTCLAVLYILFDMHKLRNKVVFSAMSLGGILVFLPVLNLISREASFSGASINRLLTHGDFGQYQGMLTAISWVEDQGLRWGHQFSGWFAFFIPRALWSGKPLSTGEVSAEALAMPFTNFSVPIQGELFVDFGYFGLVTLTIMLSYMAARLDRSAYVNRANRALSSVPFAIAFGMSGMFFRGSTIAVMPLVAIPVALAWLVVWAAPRLPGLFRPGRAQSVSLSRAGNWRRNNTLNRIGPSRPDNMRNGI